MMAEELDLYFYVRTPQNEKIHGLVIIWGSRWFNSRADGKISSPLERILQ
jgi:hypothetical protein